AFPAPAPHFDHELTSHFRLSRAGRSDAQPLPTTSAHKGTTYTRRSTDKRARQHQRGRRWGSWKLVFMTLASTARAAPDPSSRSSPARSPSTGLIGESKSHNDLNRLSSSTSSPTRPTAPTHSQRPPTHSGNPLRTRGDPTRPERPTHPPLDHLEFLKTGLVVHGGMCGATFWGYLYNRNPSSASRLSLNSLDHANAPLSTTFIAGDHTRTRRRRTGRVSSSGGGANDGSKRLTLHSSYPSPRRAATATGRLNCTLTGGMFSEFGGRDVRSDAAGALWGVMYDPQPRPRAQALNSRTTIRRIDRLFCTKILNLFLRLFSTTNVLKEGCVLVKSAVYTCYKIICKLFQFNLFRSP
ncbi:hypothetical protein JCM6882_003829, partial [Rhodosporidiobolus microsporus]